MKLITVPAAAQALALAASLSCFAAGHALSAPAPGTRPPPPMAPQAMALPPRPSADDPAKVAAAREFVVTYHPNADPKVVAAMLDKLMPQALAEMKQRNPKADAKKLIEQQRTAYLANATQGLDLQAHVVSRHFSMQELKALTAFFRGPLGKKLIDQAPTIQMEVMRERRLQQPLGGARMMMPPQGPAMKMAPPAPAMSGAPPKKP